MLDLTESARRLADVVTAVPDDRLDGPTPNPGRTVATLLGHVHGLAIAFRDAALKVDGPTTSTPPEATAPELSPGWREEIPARLSELAEAWQDPRAWTGTTQAGGLTMPGDVAGLVTLDEVVLHGWDLAVATGQAYEVDPAVTDAVERYCAEIPDDPEERQGLFGPRVPVAEDASQLDRILGLSGRDPRWRPSARVV
jgi:uncharacterized protein (TIGR03086 family)